MHAVVHESLKQGVWQPPEPVIKLYTEMQRYRVHAGRRLRRGQEGRSYGTPFVTKILT